MNEALSTIKKEQADNKELAQQCLQKEEELSIERRQVI